MKQINMEDALFKASMRVIIQPLIDERISLFDKYNNMPYEFSDKFEKRIKGIFTADKIQRGLRKSLIWGKKAVICLMVIAILVLAACMVIKPLRENIVNAVITWYDEYFTLEYVQEPGDEETGDLQMKAPSYIPKGYVLDNNTTVNNYQIILYKNEADQYIHYMSRPYDNTPDWYDSEGYIIEEISIGHINGIYMYTQDDDMNTVTWKDGGTIYIITASLSKSEIQKIAESLE